MKQLNEPGKIITFYSYKGGTGRSMALANVACSLALNVSPAGARRVLAVDWDLEAPGLHRFFRDKLLDPLPGLRNPQPGLIDIFSDLSHEVRQLDGSCEEPTSDVEAQLRKHLRLDEFVLETGIPGLHFLQAGYFDEKYATRVNTFRWDTLYRRAPWLFTWFGHLLAETYDYVLIDSRTGVTDTSGICTSILPEKLVAVFTPNLQSLEGVLDLVTRAIAYRRRSDDLRPLMVFPLPSRIEPTMEKLRRFWRFDQNTGYQPRFEKLLREAYGLSKCDLTPYFDEIQIQQVPDYAYGERISVLDRDSPGDRLSLARSYEAFVKRLLSNVGPWESQVSEYPTVFISYSAKDEEFARRLNSDLASKGIRTWFAPQDANFADNIIRQADQSIRSYDKILLILSKDAIESRWVEREIETAFDREREHSRIVLSPITIDSAVLETTDTRWASEIRRLRHIGDFRLWRDPDSYKKAFERLLRDLTAESKT